MTAGRVNTNTEKNWFTPEWLFVEIERFFGVVELDPCWCDGSPVRALVTYALPEQDGLSLPWDKKTVFVNPPYGRDPVRGTTIKNWLRLCEQAYNEGSEVICLCPVATNTSHWKSHVFPSFSRICFLKDARFKFQGASEKGAPEDFP